MKKAPRYVILKLKEQGYGWYGGFGLRRKWPVNFSEALTYSKDEVHAVASSIPGQTFVYSVSRAIEIDRSLRAIWMK